MDNEHVTGCDGVRPQLGASGFFCLELFCGSGNLTYAMKHFFPDSFGVDHKVSKQRVKVICLDLSKEDHQILVEQWALSGKCLWVHFGVPCGTASRARFRRISRRIHGPPPLRTPRFPDGLPNLKGLHAVKLRAANRLYSYMRKLIKQLHLANVIWTVENPLTSLLWETSYWKDVHAATDPFYCELHNCMFGGRRLKRTCLASNSSAVMSLNILCDGQHEHAPWSIHNGVFDTSLEAEYTPMFAKALATAILEAIAGEFKLPNVKQHAKKLKMSHFHSIAADKQPTRAMQLPTVPEYSHIIVISNLPAQHSFQIAGTVLETCTCIHVQHQQFFIPCLCKLLRQTPKKGGENRLFKFSLEQTPALQALADLDLKCKNSFSPPLTCGRNLESPCKVTRLELDGAAWHGDCCDFVFGVRWSPEDFVRQAVTMGHPFSMFSGLPDEVKRACECVADSGLPDIINNRCSKLGEWLRMSKSLQAEETELKSSMPAERRRILEGKRICLMRHIILSEGYDDKDLASDLELGFSLVGEVPLSHILPAKLLPASLTTTDLAVQSNKSNVALRYMTRSSGSAELDGKLWERTLLEAERGWLIGPLSWDSLEKGSTVSRRFPIEQAGKVRPIDDLSQSQINATVTCFEQATVDGPDVICAFAVYLMRCLLEKGKPTALLGRALDLASAYRQLAIADDSKRHAYLSVYSPVSGRAELFRQVALPFGSRTAVNAFIRCARFLQWVAARCLKIPVSCYFDDFVSFAYPALASNTQAAMCLMLDILGWRFDREGPKSDDFSLLVRALGVEFNLAGCSDGLLTVGNTEKRVQETVALVERVLKDGALDKKQALVLRGRLAFCDGFIFGRLGKIALQNITRHAYSTPFCRSLSPNLVDSLKLLKDRILLGKPRQLTCNLLETMFLFTDASFDMARGAGLGAVLFSTDGSVIAWFSLWADIGDLATFLPEGRETAIGELETLAVAMSLFVWHQRLKSSQLMVYIDNEGSKFSLIKGYSSTLAVTAICALAATFLDSHCILPWYSRVPSASNIADYPSRQIHHPLLKEDLKIPEGEIKEAFRGSMEFISQAKAPHESWVGAVAKAGGVKSPSLS